MLCRAFPCSVGRSRAPGVSRKAAAGPACDPRARNPGAASGVRNPEVRRRVSTLLEMVGVGDLVDRLPGSLPSGQQQRVAFARALAPRSACSCSTSPSRASTPTCGSRSAPRSAGSYGPLGHRDLRHPRSERGQNEAFVLGDEVAVMRDGYVVQQDMPAEVDQHPADDGSGPPSPGAVAALVSPLRRPHLGRRPGRLESH